MTKEIIVEFNSENMELEISKRLKCEPYYRIKEFYMIGNQLSIVLESYEQKKYPNYVKQGSKAKYPELSMYFKKFLGVGGSLRHLVETPTMWLLVFER